ncbi:hypothetical protein FPV67DRAFT_1394377, partial [Lyophyllum atratum]
FVVHADQLYGPITTQRANGKITKKILWTDFALTDSDWERVDEAREILTDPNRVLHQFSSEKQPTLYRALPTIESLQTTWEEKLEDDRYALYHPALQDGLDKLMKYYTRFDKKPAYILSLFLHPFFKLHYIKMAWGGAEEQRAEIRKGNLDAKDWVDEARQIVEATMEKYWATRPSRKAAAPTKP